ncbi:hypothetical protein GW17_00054639 [Ensete ventricosum]|nr:hypothetical protein GW17_00054639 [Ensete ventricosum]
MIARREICMIHAGPVMAHKESVCAEGCDCLCHTEPRGPGRPRPRSYWSVQVAPPSPRSFAKRIPRAQATWGPRGQSVNWQSREGGFWGRFVNEKELVRANTAPDTDHSLASLPGTAQEQ